MFNTPSIEARLLKPETDANAALLLNVIGPPIEVRFENTGNAVNKALPLIPSPVPAPIVARFPKPDKVVRFGMLSNPNPVPMLVTDAKPEIDVAVFPDNEI